MNSSRIPKIIWQTYRTNDLPEHAIVCRDSWKSLNPDWQYVFMGDDEICRFVKENVSDEIYELFSNFPLGVMRADFWRYLVTSVHGGLYTDIDTLCREPIDNWLPDDADFVVCPENATHLCQWTFLATPSHPCLTSVIELVAERTSKGIDTSDEHFVHYSTGPGVWTDGIKRAIGCKETDMMRLSSIKNSKSMKKQHVHIFDWQHFRHSKVKHFFGSRTWGEDYSSWITLRDQLSKD